MARTIGFNHRDVQVTAQGTGVNIIQGKRPWRYDGAVNRIAVLAHFHAGVTVSDAAHHRRVAAATVRQHFRHAGKLCATELEAIENVVIGVALTN